MKSLVEFKKESIKVSPSPEEWVTVYNKLILLFADWGLTEEYIDSFLYTWEGDLANDCFEADFIDHLIYYALCISTYSTLFGRMFEITKTTVLTPYFDCDKWDFRITTETEILREGREVYEKLEDIKKIFPIYIKY